MHVRTAWQAVTQWLVVALLASATLGAACYKYVGGSLSDLEVEALDYGTPHYYAAPFAQCVAAVQATMADTLAAQWEHFTWDVLLSDSVIQRRDSVAVWTVSQPEVRDSVWTFAGWTTRWTLPEWACPHPSEALHQAGFFECRRVRVRAAVRDEGTQGIAVRIIARAHYSTSTSDQYFGGIFKSTRVDLPGYLPVAAMFAALDQRLPRKETMQHP